MSTFDQLGGSFESSTALTFPSLRLLRRSGFPFTALIRPHKHDRWNRQPSALAVLRSDHKLKLHWLLDGQIRLAS